MKALIACLYAIVLVNPCYAAVVSPMTRGEVSFAYGVKAYNRGDYREALVRFEEALASDPDDGTARYWMGITRLHLGDAPRAASDIKASLTAPHPASVERGRVLVDLGTAQLEGGDIAAAEHSVDEALALRPTDPAALYLHGLVLARLGNRAQGRTEAEHGRALDASLPELPQQSVVPGTTELVNASELPFWELRVSGDLGYDSNPGGFPDDLDAFDPKHPNERISGDDGLGSGTLRAEVHPFYDKAGWSLGLRGDGFHSWHPHLDQFDVSRGAGAVQLAYGKDPVGYVTGPLGYTRVPKGNDRFSLLFQGGVSNSWLDGEDSQRTYEGAASIILRENSLTATQLEFDYQDLTFFGTSLSSSANDFSGYETYLRASQYFFLGRRDRYLRVLGLGGISDRRRADFDSTFFGAGVEFTSPLYKNIYLQFGSNWRHDDFDRHFQGDSHDENVYNATAALIWAPVSHLYLTARSTFIDREVEPHPLDNLIGYDREIVSLGLTFYY